jgi:hypothetical protein
MAEATKGRTVANLAVASEQGSHLLRVYICLLTVSLPSLAVFHKAP